MNSELSSYDALIGPNKDQMIRTIWRITRGTEDAEDALQESLTVIWKRRTKIFRHPHPRAFVLRICINCAYDVRRARLRRTSREVALSNPNALQTEQAPVEQLLCRQELSEDISLAILQLPNQQAMAVTMRDLLELPYQEIGSALGCSESTARVHVNRAHKTLNKLLAHLNPSQEKESKNERCQ